jgi:hypothetical protein
MREQGCRLAYVFVFECEICKRDVCAFFQTDKPELDFHLTCACGWVGTRRGTQVKKILCQAIHFTTAKKRVLSAAAWAKISKGYQEALGKTKSASKEPLSPPH